MFPFEKILTYIANEQCALVVGPEIMHFEGKPMHLYLRDKLYQQFRADLIHYYDQDGLFLFPSEDETVKSDVAQALRTECQKLPEVAGYNEALLKNIARLPFHLILSINPDTFLSDTFYKYGVVHRFSHHRKGDRPSDEVASPTREEPLIYNVAGSILEDESLILDYDDLFSMIGSTLGATGLPGGMQTALSKIRTYIFVGFPFEKWYTHVTLRILCGKAAYRKYAGPHDMPDETRTFLANQFKIDFWKPDEGDFWDALMASAEVYKYTDPQKANQSFLRPLLEDPLAPEETGIVREIQNAQFTRAIASLMAFAKGMPQEMEAVQLSSRYQALAQNQSRIDSRDFLVTLNQISDAVIQLAHQIAQSK